MCKITLGSDDTFVGCRCDCQIQGVWFKMYYVVDRFAVELFVYIFHSFEAGIANAISSLK